MARLISLCVVALLIAIMFCGVVFNLFQLKNAESLLQDASRAEMERTERIDQHLTEAVSAAEEGADE